MARELGIVREHIKRGLNVERGKFVDRAEAG